MSPSTIPAGPKPALASPRILLTLFAALALLLASCGSDATTDASGAGDDTTVPPPDQEDEGTDDGGTGAGAEPVVQDGSDYQPTVAMLDMTDPQSSPIDDVVVSDDGLTLGVRYTSAAEPCSGAVASVVEDDSTITVTLETGLNPNAAAMTCVAQVMAYELAVPLDAPVGDREIVIAE